jgi:hypothetical protein
VERFFDDVARAYDRGIQAPGKELHFLVLVAFMLSFGFIRTSAHMIRAQVSWWPGNVETKGGTHVHHMVWGILLLLSMGYLGITTDLGSPWMEFVAIVFGIGMGLTLDEFALWLNLEDVYWAPKGRQSIDAVIVASCLLAIALLGLQFWIDVYEALLILLGVGGQTLEADETKLVLIPLQTAGVALALICFIKGKRFAGIVGLFVPLVGLVGALRLGRPESPWGRRYEAAKRERAQARFAQTA